MRRCYLPRSSSPVTVSCSSCSLLPSSRDSHFRVTSHFVPIVSLSLLGQVQLKDPSCPRTLSAGAPPNSALAHLSRGPIRAAEGNPRPPAFDASRTPLSGPVCVPKTELASTISGLPSRRRHQCRPGAGTPRHGTTTSAALPRRPAARGAFPRPAWPGTRKPRCWGRTTVTTRATIRAGSEGEFAPRASGIPHLLSKCFRQRLGCGPPLCAVNPQGLHG